MSAASACGNFTPGVTPCMGQANERQLDSVNNTKQDCFLQKEARVCNAFVTEDSQSKCCFFVVVEDEQITEEADMLM